MGRPAGSGNKFKKPDFIIAFDKYRRKYKVDPVEALFQFSVGKDADGVDMEIPVELRYRATKDLVTTRYSPATIATFDQAVMQQDMFDKGADQKIVFGVPNAA